MKKGLKTALISSLLLVPMVFCGCDNPFGDSNSIGSDKRDPIINPDPTPSDGGGKTDDPTPTPEPTPEESRVYNPYDYTDSGLTNPFSDITSSVSYVKSVYKNGSSNIDDATISARKLAYENASSNILKRLVAEYGIGAVDIDGTSVAPLSNVGVKTFTDCGLLKAGYTATQQEIDAVVADFLKAKYIVTNTVSGSMQYMIISTEPVTSSDVLPSLVYDSTLDGVKLSNTTFRLSTVFSIGLTNPLTSSTYLFNEQDAFYKVVHEATNKEYYLIYNNNFINKFASDNDGFYNKIVDTHRDGIRYNKVSLEMSADALRTVYDLKTLSWNICRDNNFTYTGTDAEEYATAFVNAYKQKITLELASVMTFGVNSDKTINFPEGNVKEGYSFSGTIKDFYRAAKVDMGAYYNDYLKFCFTYIEHNGFVSYEADAIAEYLAEQIIGKDILALEQNRFSTNAIGANYQSNFNSNEKVEVDGVVTVRKLISNYNNTNVRALADNKTEVFKSINYNKDLTLLDSNDSNDVLTYHVTGSTGTKFDTRRALFKNYLNTMYSACYSLVTGSSDDISLEYCDIDYSYLQNVTIIEESAPEESEETGEDTGEGEDTENYITDTYLGGKLQSIVIFPKEAVDIRYIEIGLEAILNDGDSIAVSVDLRYCYEGRVYYVESAFQAEGGDGVLTSDEALSNFEYFSGYDKNGNVGSGPKFKDENGTIMNEKLLSLKNFVANDEVPELRKAKTLLGPQVGKKTATSSDYKYNQFATNMGANYCYGVYDKDFIEICFNVKPNYKDFDTNYTINAKLVSIYGKKL